MHRRNILNGWTHCRYFVQKSGLSQEAYLRLLISGQRAAQGVTAHRIPCTLTPTVRHWREYESDRSPCQWAVSLIGSLFIIVLSFIMIMSVYGRYFRLYLYTAIAPVPLSSFAGEPTSSIGKAFLRSYAAVCLEGAVIVLACIIFSAFAASPPAVNPSASPVTMVWGYLGELIFNLLVLVGCVKMADRVVREMCGL